MVSGELRSGERAEEPSWKKRNVLYNEKYFQERWEGVMNVLDLLFLLAFLAAVVTVASAAISAARGRRAEALKILRGFGLCAVSYLAAAPAVAYLKPQ
jgi:hypothetical protein